MIFFKVIDEKGEITTAWYVGYNVLISWSVAINVSSEYVLDESFFYISNVKTGFSDFFHGKLLCIRLGLKESPVNLMSHLWVFQATF